MRLRAATAAAVAILLATAGPAAAATPDWEGELFPAEYDRPGVLTFSGEVTWTSTGALAGHPGNATHTGRLEVTSEQSAGQPEQTSVFLRVRDEDCGEGGCTTVFEARGRAEVETVQASPLGGTLRLAGELTDPDLLVVRPGVTPPPLDFDVTISADEFTPFANQGPRRAQEVRRERSQWSDRYSWRIRGGTGVGGRAAGLLTGFRPEAEAGVEAAWRGQYGDDVELSRRIVPPSSARNWVPQAGENGSAAGRATGRWTGRAPTTSTGARLPGNAWSGDLTWSRRFGDEPGTSFRGRLRAWHCDPGETLTDCELLGHYRFTGPFGIRVGESGRVTATGYGELRGTREGPMGTLPLTLDTAPLGRIGQATITTIRGFGLGSVFQSHQRSVRLPARISVGLGSLTLLPSQALSANIPGGPPTVSFDRQFTLTGS